IIIAVRSLCASHKIFFFFFQAEDGIRDFHVTGVQTCALPISRSLLLLFVLAAFSSCKKDEAEEPAAPAPAGSDLQLLQSATDGRSEERRVGKECRSRGSREAATTKVGSGET